MDMMREERMLWYWIVEKQLFLALGVRL